MKISADISIFKNSEETLKIFKCINNLADYDLYITLMPDQYKLLQKLFPFKEKEYILFYITGAEKKEKIEICGSTAHYDIEKIEDIKTIIMEVI